MGQENYDDFQAAIHDPETVIGMLGDYRAGIALDHLHDREGRQSGRKLKCPLYVLWSLRDDLNIFMATYFRYGSHGQNRKLLAQELTAGITWLKKPR